MDRDEFIISVYCLVCEHYPVIQALYGVRHGGFAPALTDEEVITMEICGECFKCATDKDLYAYFRAHYRHFFPQLKDRTLFVRQAANLWQVKAAIQHPLTVVRGQAADPVQVIDTVPLPVCGYTRAGISASNPRPITATVRRKISIIMGLSGACASAVAA